MPLGPRPRAHPRSDRGGAGAGAGGGAARRGAVRCREAPLRHGGGPGRVEWGLVRTAVAGMSASWGEAFQLPGAGRGAFHWVLARPLARRLHVNGGRREAPLRAGSGEGRRGQPTPLAQQTGGLDSGDGGDEGDGGAPPARGRAAHHRPPCARRTYDPLFHLPAAAASGGMLPPRRSVHIPGAGASVWHRHPLAPIREAGRPMRAPSSEAPWPTPPAAPRGRVGRIHDSGGAACHRGAPAFSALFKRLPL